MAGLSSSHVLFVTITYMLLRCGFGTQRTAKLVYQPYGPKMCRELCKHSSDSLFFVLEDLSCNRIEAPNVSSSLPTFKVTEATLIKGKCQVAVTKWDICNVGLQGLELEMKKDAACSRVPQLIQHNRDITLHRACEEGRLAVVKYILFHGIADINCRGKLEMTPLMMAVKHGHREVTDFLIGKGGDLMVIDKFGDNILHVACIGGHVNMVKYIVSMTITDIESRGQIGRTPLMMAVGYGHREVTDFLISKGGDLMVINTFGDNILHVACIGGHVNMVKYIVSMNITDIESRGQIGRTPLMMAVGYGHREVTDFLISKGGDLMVIDKFGDNILHAACLVGHINMVKYIISMNITDIESRGQLGWTPLMMTVWHGHRAVTDFLISKGGDLMVIDKGGNNILHAACNGGHINMVKHIVSINITGIESRGQLGRTPLMIAVVFGHREVTDFLISKGGDLMVIDKGGSNILHAACLGGHVNMVKYIVSINITDINSKSKGGLTPVMIAAMNGHREIVKFLVRKKCNLKLVDSIGNTILHTACIGGDVHMVKYLITLPVVGGMEKKKNYNGRIPVKLAQLHNRNSVFKFLKHRI